MRDGRACWPQIKKVDKLPGSGAWPAYNERFQRMWDFYLCNCEAEFTTGHFGLGQFILRAPSKDYRGEVRVVVTLPRASPNSLCTASTSSRCTNTVVQMILTFATSRFGPSRVSVMQAIDDYLPRLPSLYLEPGVRSTNGGALATDKKTK